MTYKKRTAPLDLLALAQALIRCPSLTPEDAGCQDILAQNLRPWGFKCTDYSQGGVRNLWALLEPAPELPLFCFAGHTDVVPTGDLSLWHSPPFEPTLREGRLYGRGAADMKSALAAMITATQRFLRHTPKPNMRLAFLITSDEEGPALQGTRYVVEQLSRQGIQINYCLVGEPSSSAQLGDTLRIGRRGTLTGYLKILGRQGHVAYPELANNPIHAVTPFLQALIQHRWDFGTPDFPETTLQVANIQAGTGTTNVIPGALSLNFNLRYNPSQTVQSLQTAVYSLLEQHALSYTLDWQSGGEPFYTAPQHPFVQKAIHAIEQTLHHPPILSTGGGTSDGRFIAPTGAAVIELGLQNRSIHQVNESVPLAAIESLETIYYSILERIHHG